MGSESTQFEAVVIGAVGVVLGVAYLFGAMLALLSTGGVGVLILSGSVPVTASVGVLLMLVAGLIGTGHGYGRYLGMLSFGAVVVFGRPSFASPEPLAVTQVAVASLMALYLVFRNPVPKTERSNVDESTSASKVGSTIR